MIWKGFLLTLSWLGRGLILKAGNGSSIRLGVDPIVGLGSSYLLPHDLRDDLEDFGICTLEQARNHTPFAQSYWFMADELDIHGEWKLKWDSYIRGLEYGRIRLSDFCDSLLWEHNQHVGPLTAALGYDCIDSSYCSKGESSALDSLWNLNIPLKISCFIWLTIKIRIPTWDQLQHRGMQGPSRCVLCSKGEENAQHLFLDCSFSKGVLSFFVDRYGFPPTHFDSISSFLEHWFSSTPIYAHFSYLPIFFYWCIWNLIN